MKASINTWVYGFNHPILDSVRKIAAHGFQGVEVPFRDEEFTWSRSQTGELQSALHDSGIRVATLLVALGMLPPEKGRNLSSADSLARQRAIEYCRSGFELAHTLGADRIVLNVGKLGDGQEEEDAFSMAADSIRTLLEELAEGSTRVVLENFPDRWIGPSARMRTLIERVGHPRFGALLDTGHQNVLKEPFENALREVGSSFYHLHLNNNFGEQDTHNPPSEGSLSRQDYLDDRLALMEAGYDGWYSFEVFGADRGRDPDAVCRDCMALNGL
jgi:sugar phosphate isomerase/epimerase